MYLWRSLPDGQLLAVLRWMQNRRDAKRTSENIAAPDTARRPEEKVEPAGR